MNIRELLNYKEPYFRINREERNLAAIFYHVLLINNNLEKFLQKLKVDFPIVSAETGIYFEYAHLRDIWFNHRGITNLKKQKVILDLLQPVNYDGLLNLSVLDFNRYFGAVPVPSAEYIQSPGNWSISRFKQNIIDNVEFLKVCRFKWCFNAKPDIVIHTSNDHVICIEAKYESGEGQYPSKQSERDEFKKRGLKQVGQTEIQTQIMQLLGIESTFIFLVQKTSASDTHDTLLWKEAFDGLDLHGCPRYITETINKL
ncbi:hypothetical protein [Saccharicrinis sp. FJH54]|uniref:hypothetical protein n=1 Tax=Saccharicrinis sp. FJH54 TaxID=3344665 RepID=UPI0035D3FC30